MNAILVTDVRLAAGAWKWTLAHGAALILAGLVAMLAGIGFLASGIVTVAAAIQLRRQA